MFYKNGYSGMELALVFPYTSLKISTKESIIFAKGKTTGWFKCPWVSFSYTQLTAHSHCEWAFENEVYITGQCQQGSTYTYLVE